MVLRFLTRYWSHWYTSKIQLPLINWLEFSSLDHSYNLKCPSGSNLMYWVDLASGNAIRPSGFPGCVDCTKMLRQPFVKFVGEVFALSIMPCSSDCPGTNAAARPDESAIGVFTEDEVTISSQLKGSILSYGASPVGTPDNLVYRYREQSTAAGEDNEDSEDEFSAGWGAEEPCDEGGAIKGLW
uniref:Uncharacterized protein n=1 Tax=Oryza nivara TaxID=4536 RepID=A0A0E0HY11_ORYNI